MTNKEKVNMIVADLDGAFGPFVGSAFAVWEHGGK